jgi:hypothetical protein
MNNHQGTKSYRVWVAGTNPQLSLLDPYLDANPDLAHKVLIFLCPSANAAHQLICTAQELGLEAETIDRPLPPTPAWGAYNLHPNHPTWYTEQRRLIWDTFQPGQAFSAQQIADLLGLKQPRTLVQSMITLGQLEMHGTRRNAYYTLGPNRP